AGAGASWGPEDLRGLHLDPDVPGSPALAGANTRTVDRVGLEIQATLLRAALLTAAPPAGLVPRQQAGTDRPELADWTGQGAIVGIQGGTEQVRNTLAELQQASTQVAGVWLQDWTGQRTTSFGDRLWWTWQLDADRYPGWADLVADLDAEGIAVTTYVNPFLVDPTGKDHPPERNLFAEAAEHG